CLVGSEMFIRSSHTNVYPESDDWLSSLLNKVSSQNYLDEQMHATLGEYYEPLRFVKSINRQSAIQARLPYYLNIK
ncbi:MAG: hypothetical protein K2K03_06570, partial [Prevotella sp.]|nr:hypothetical protein [Prevotella sp.]